MKKYLLGFDIGTEGSKGLIMDLDGNIEAYHYVRHEVEHPHPGWAEHDGDAVWWGDFVKIVRKLLQDSKIDPKAIAGIGCSGVTPCVLPVDENGTPLRNAMLYGIDTRADKEIKLFRDTFPDDQIDRLCRAHLSSQSVGPKLMWLKKHEPEVFEKAAMFLSSSNYVVYKLTGACTTNLDNACQFSPMYNAHTRDWDESMCAFSGITSAQLPKILPATAVAGSVTSAAQAETGLAAGTPVIVGAGDYSAELLSMGGQEGDTLLTYGSTMVFCSITRETAYRSTLFSIPHPVDESMQFFGGGTATAASITKWFRDNFGYEELQGERSGGKNAYSALSAQAEAVPAGSEGLIALPYFAGERTPIWDEKAKGVLFGLTLAHTKAHVYRALIESVAYSALHHMEEMADSGIPVTRLVAAGGGARSHVWTQIMSDVTGVPQICLPEISGSPAGSAYLAGLGTGVLQDDSILRNKLTDGMRHVAPNPENTEKYRPYYRIYRQLYSQTKSLMHELHDLANRG